MLGGELMKAFGSGAVGWDRGDFNITVATDLRLKIKDLSPKVVINCVAYNDVDGAEEKPEVAFKLNAEAVGELARVCKDLGIPLVHFSSNYIFDGEKGEYKESDLPDPQSVYAKSKYQGEQELIKNTDKYYLIRTAVIFGTKGESELSKKSFVELMLDLSKKSDTIKAVNDEVNSVTYVKDLAAAVKALLAQNLPYGTYHITNSGQASWHDFAQEIFIITGKKVAVVPVPSTDFPRKASRPKKSVLINTKLPPFRPWQEALREFLTAY